MINVRVKAVITIFESSENLIFNGIDLAARFRSDAGGYFLVNAVRGREAMPEELEVLAIPGRAGGVIASSRRPVRILEVEITLKGDNRQDLRKKIEDLNALLYTNEEVPIEFADEPDRVYYGRFSGTAYKREVGRIYQALLMFTCSDPYKYGPELEAVFPSDVVTLTNKGTAEAEPIFELEVKKPVTFAMISNQDDEYMMIGSPADVETEVVDERILVMNETGSTLDTWQEAPGSTGRFRGSDNGIFVDSYGSGTEWHGPRLIKEIDPLEDFEIEFVVNARTNRADQTFRISTNYYDEYNNELGMLRLWDLSIHRNHKVVEARVGPYVGQHVNYPISSRNYNIQDQLVWYGLIRVVREGNFYTFYVARIDQRGRHVDTLTQTFYDANKEFAGRLKYIRIDIAKYAGTETATEVSIGRISVYKRNRVEEDQTPYIAYPGDVIEFDHKNADILINGESRADLKQLGASFFKLKPGENQLVILPGNSLDVKCRYRPTYL